jgi:sec-independent protein translocase protein TatA
MLNGLQPWHLIIVLVVLVLLFGARRLPDAARSIGKSMKIFKAETKSMHDEDKAEEPEARQLPPATAQVKTSDQQVAELQRQLDELKKQQSAGAEQPQKNAS